MERKNCRRCWRLEVGAPQKRRRFWRLAVAMHVTVIDLGAWLLEDIWE